MSQLRALEDGSPRLHTEENTNRFGHFEWDLSKDFLQLPTLTIHRSKTYNMEERSYSGRSNETNIRCFIDFLPSQFQRKEHKKQQINKIII